jgi:cytochrome c
VPFTGSVEEHVWTDPCRRHRPAGTLPRFAYSDALKASGIVWTEDSLRQWLANNEKLVPGTRMKHVSITDPAAQDFLIAYIGSL